MTKEIGCFFFEWFDIHLSALAYNEQMVKKNLVQDEKTKKKDEKHT